MFVTRYTLFTFDCWHHKMYPKVELFIPLVHLFFHLTRDLTYIWLIFNIWYLMLCWRAWNQMTLLAIIRSYVWDGYIQKMVVGCGGGLGCCKCRVSCSRASITHGHLVIRQCYSNDPWVSLLWTPNSGISWFTPCLASPQPQMSYPRAGPPTPSLIHMVELEFVGLWNNPRQIFAQLQKLGVKLART